MENGASKRRLIERSGRTTTTLGAVAFCIMTPANRLERLVGNREGQYSIRVNDQWRICFVWQDGDALDVEIVDYH